MDRETRDWCRDQAIKATAEEFRIKVQNGDRPWERWGSRGDVPAGTFLNLQVSPLRHSGTARERSPSAATGTISTARRDTTLP